MYHELASKLFISASGSEVTQAVNMEGYNAVCIEVTLFTASVLTITLWCSNDGANRSQVTGSATVPSSGTGPTYSLIPHSTYTQVAARWVRVKVATNATAAVVALGINCANIGA